MGLTNDLISQFVKITNDDKKTDTETTVYGTIEVVNDSTYIILDGDNEKQNPIPLSNNQLAVTVVNGDRVRATIKNHNLVVTGNIKNPSATTEDVRKTIDAFDAIVASKASIEELYAERARIDVLVTEDLTIKNRLSANEIDVANLMSYNVTVSATLKANSADISTLKTDKLDAGTANLMYASITDLDAAEAAIYNLEATYGDFSVLVTDRLSVIDADISDLKANKLSATDIEGKYANIDFSNISKAAIEYFYATSGLIKDVVVGDGTVTGRLVGVTISGDLIEGNTVKAEKLVIKGSDGMYYKLNTDGMKTEAEQTDQNSLNGSIIKAKSITATKISVDDLVAFDATIGGFNISEKSLYSGVKNSASNTTRGIYLDSEGQMAVGDSSNFIKYYKDSDGTYKLAISASSIIFSANNKSVATAIDEVQASVNNIEVGGTNLLLKSASKQITPYGSTTSTSEYGLEVEEWRTSDAMRIHGTGGTSTIFGTLGGTSSHGASSETQSYAVSIYIKNNHATNSVVITANHIGTIYKIVAPQESARVELVGPGNGWGYLQINFKTEVAGDEFDITYWHPKIELGNKPTDWTPAPEDLAMGEDLDIVRSISESAEEKATSAESLIQQLTDSISMLVTDGNGTSLMTQTETGWTFSTADIETIVNRASENLNSLTDELGDTNNVVGLLRQAVDDLGVIAEYVNIGTYEDEPCIELGEGDSEFKLRITNTRMIFTEGSIVLAYFNNQSFHVKKAVVEEELQQGGFVWKARSNGNLGLIWKGVTS